MTSTLALCRIRINEGDETDLTNLHSLTDDDNSSIDATLRHRWATEILRKFLDSVSTRDRPHQSIRDWDFVLLRDGRVENLADQQPTRVENPLDHPSENVSDENERIYPVEYRLDVRRLEGLESDERRIHHREMFAIGSLMYEVQTLHEPFHEHETVQDLEGEERETMIESLFAEGQVPNDVWELPSRDAIAILSCWCPEFIRVIRQREQGNWSSRFMNYVRAHPGRFSLQLGGAGIALASVAVFPLLGAAGFAATGPVAGSTAAAWQASIGLVEAGSFFAWCQSAAMGGAAVGGIFAAGASGAAVLTAATALRLLDNDEFSRLEVSPQELRELFLAAWNRPRTD